MIDNYLTTLRASCQQRKVPLISPESQNILLKILTTYQPKNCLEIGSAIGYSGIFIAKTIAEWGGNLASFEVAYPSYLEAQYHARQCQITNVKRYPFDLSKIEDTSNILPKQCDFVFIDAQKNQY
jgi:caffeoyl-coA O-methyltransferase